MRQSPRSPSPSKLTRRDLIRRALTNSAALGSLMVAGALKSSLSVIKGSEEDEKPLANAEQKNRNFAVAYNERTRLYRREVSAGDIAGLKAGGLLKGVLGIEGTIPPTYTYDGHEALKYAWTRKAANFELSDAAKDKAPKLIREFEVHEKHLMSISQYAQNINLALSRVKENFDFVKVAALYRLDGKRTNILKQVMMGLDSRHMIPYMLTEMFPDIEYSREGVPSPRNIKLLDFVLRNMGPEFIDMIPAQGDGYLSIGGFQFTSIALGESDDFTAVVSRLNHYILKHELQIPKSVYLLRGGDQHVAAWLLALHHVAMTLKKIKDDQTVAAVKFFAGDDSLIGFLGACHNQSASTEDFARFINAYKNGSFPQYVQFVRKNPELRNRVSNHYTKTLKNAHAWKVHGPIAYDTNSNKAR